MHFENNPWTWPSEYAEAIITNLQKTHPDKDYCIRPGQPLPFDDPPTVTALVFERERKMYEPKEKEIVYIRHWTTKSDYSPGYIEITAPLEQSVLEKIIMKVKQKIQGRSFDQALNLGRIY